MLRVFAVKDEEGIVRGSGLEELTRKLLFIVVVLCSIDMSTVVLVLESTVDKHDSIIDVRELAVQDFDDSLLVNSG